MRLNHTIESNLCIIRFEDAHFDKFSVLQAYIRPFLDDPSLQGIIINLQGVELINSSSVGGLLMLSSQIRKIGKKFAVSEVGDSVQHVLEEISHLKDVLPLFPTITDAMTELSKIDAPESLNSLLRGIPNV